MISPLVSKVKTKKPKVFKIEQFIVHEKGSLKSREFRSQWGFADFVGGQSDRRHVPEPPEHPLNDGKRHLARI
jgi:hypothetical protein